MKRYILLILIASPISHNAQARSSTLRGLFGGAGTGAFIGGVADGGKGAGYGAVVGGVSGMTIGALQDAGRRDRYYDDDYQYDDEPDYNDTQDENFGNGVYYSEATRSGGYGQRHVRRNNGQGHRNQYSNRRGHR